MTNDPEWEKMLAEYLARVPAPVFRTDPPIKTSLEEQMKNEEPDIDSE